MPPEPAGLIVSGGTILTQDPAQPVAQAMAVRGSRILAVGTAEDIAPFWGPATRVINAGGRTIVPGLIDAHAHMEREGLKSQRPSLSGLRSIGAIQDVVAREAARLPRGQWIITMPVGDPPHYFGGPAVLAEGRMPTRHELDAVAPDHPVYIAGAFNNWGEPPGYSALNTLALRENAITAATQPNCPGIEICKDADGELTGIIIETNQRPAVEFDLLPAVPRFGWDERLDGIRASLKAYNAVGVTSAYEGHGSSPETLALYRALWERGELTVRLSLVVSPTWTDNAQATRDLRDMLLLAQGRGFGDDWLRVSGVFIGLSGDVAIRQAAMAALPDTGWSGFVEHANTMSEYRDYVMLAAQMGFRVHTIAPHSLGQVLAIWAEADTRFGIRDKRWVLEHVAVVDDAAMAMIKALGVHVTTIPSKTLWKRGPKLATLDPLSGEQVTPHRTFLERGIPIAIGTDNVPINPFYAMWNTMARECRGGDIVGPGQCLSLTQALPLVTREGAALSFDESRKGMLRAGMLADFAVLDADLSSTPLNAIKDVGASMTVVNGAIVHET